MEDESILETSKPDGRRARLERSKKARDKRHFLKEKKEKEYEDKFYGNL